MTVVSILIILEGFDIFSIGAQYSKRSFFGFQMPFYKATGLPLSDGKIGTMIGPVFLLLLLNIFFYKDRFTKLLFRHFQLLLILAGIIICQSRSGWLALSVCLAYLFSSFFGKYTRFFTKFLLLFGGIFILVNSGLFFKSLVGEGIYAYNVFHRGNSNLFAFTKFIESPIIGVGHSNLNFIEFSELHGNQWIETAVHNLFFDQLGSNGITGFIPLIGLFIVYFSFVEKLYLQSIRLNANRIKLFCIWLKLSMIFIVIELNLYKGFYNEYLFLYFSFPVFAYLKLKSLEVINYR